MTTLRLKRWPPLYTLTRKTPEAREARDVRRCRDSVCDPKGKEQPSRPILVDETTGLLIVKEQTTLAARLLLHRSFDQSHLLDPGLAVGVHLVEVDAG